MEVWIPEKIGIETMLRNLADTVKYADNIMEIETELDDQLSGLQCHVANRAAIERGEIQS